MPRRRTPSSPTTPTPTAPGPHPTLPADLRERILADFAALKVPLRAEQLDAVLARAGRDGLSHQQFLHLLITEQAGQRRERSITHRIREARFAERKPPSEFDWEFTVAGKIDSNTLKGRTPYFGELQIALAEARTLRSRNAGTETELTLDGKYASNTEWMETEVELSPGDPMDIRAGDAMFMQRGGNGNECGPAGNDNYRNGPYGPGQLLGRIGKNGKVFSIGEKYKGAPGESGRLYPRAFR